MDAQTVLLAIIPPLLAISLAIITKQVILSLFLAIFVGATMLNSGNVWTGLFDTFFTFILPGFENVDHQRMICFCAFCGGLSLMLERGGGAEAFATTLTKNVVKTRRGGQLVTWLGGVAIWFSDSTNPVLIGPIFRNITDKLRISREKLAYIVDSTTAAVPTLFTLSAWGAYIIGIIETSYQELSYNGNPTSDFLAGVPYQYYTIGSIVMVLIIAITGWDYGPMKRAEDRALKTGKLVEDGAEVRSHTEKRELPAGAKPSIWNMIIPLVVLIILIFVGMAYTGDAATNGFVGALAAGSSLKSLVIAFFITAIVAGALAIRSKVMNFKEAVSTFIEGCCSMMEVLIIMMLAWGIGSVCSACGTSDFIVQVSENLLTPATMCIIIFVAACLTSFSTGSSWSVFAIFTPIAISMALAIDAPVGMAIGVVLSGGIFGDHCSPISDTTVLSSVGSSCNHIDHVKTQLPYALTVASAAFVGYLITGFIGGNGFIGLAITLILICIISFTLNRQFGRKKQTV
ncbi:Na+/H+ antiporter NhaC family protein [uncultured Flavonifractor sp.]|uniref:Na+/H+ antiporter NhaC family protein n=1 Tax=uncultured Flavonifractor sp. TaxID=1193534 RepID=UPI002609AEDF|nr:Na+/H+ antiporter NhaC family protein [uncultured Flavonifractor sp.]